MRKVGGPGIVVGLDEVGRGALAGPLTVAAVALPDEPEVIGIDDSKKLSPKRREALAAQIEDVAYGIGICHIPPEDIDACGMSASLKVAFSRALASCEADIRERGNGKGADAVLIDGNPIHIHAHETCIVKGDGKVACIAAASIVAKVTRDALMIELSSSYPAYGFDSNKGYGSAAHIDAIKNNGPSDVHRRSFLGNILSEQQRLL
ncbi:MAG: ribonuclease HII [Coriobacteriales bacterium]|jgi:ribonuclease HII